MGIANIILITFGLVGYLIYHHYTRFDALLKRSIDDCKEGRTTPYKTIQQRWREEAKWEKKHPVQTFFKDCYWYVRRGVIAVFEFPNDFYRKCKRGVQRAYRGWADEDTWNLEHYLSKVIHGSLKRLFKYRSTFKTNNTGDDKIDWNKKESDAIKRDILFAWKIQKDISDGKRKAHHPELKPNLQKKFKCLTHAEELRRKKGMELFDHHFGSLWD